MAEKKTSKVAKQRKYEQEFARLSEADKINQAGLLVTVLRIVIAKISRQPPRKRRIVTRSPK